jgi:hypothetical protein
VAARQNGRAVHVLWCDSRLPTFVKELTHHDITISLLDNSRLPPSLTVPNVHGECPSEGSDRVRYALEHLHERLGFDLILFPALGGLAFRTIQARQGGIAFQGVTLAVSLDSCSACEREEAERWAEGLDDLELDYLERRSFERADVQRMPCDVVREYVRKCGWSGALFSRGSENRG